MRPCSFFVPSSPRSLEDVVFIQITDIIVSDSDFQVLRLSLVRQAILQYRIPRIQWGNDFADFPQILSIALFRDLYYGYLNRLIGYIPNRLLPQLFLRLMKHHFVRPYLRLHKPFLLREAQKQRKRYHEIRRYYRSLSYF